MHHKRRGRSSVKGKKKKEGKKKGESQDQKCGGPERLKRGLGREGENSEDDVRF